MRPITQGFVAIALTCCSACSLIFDTDDLNSADVGAVDAEMQIEASPDVPDVQIDVQEEGCSESAALGATGRVRGPCPEARPGVLVEVTLSAAVECEGELRLETPWGQSYMRTVSAGDVVVEQCVERAPTLFGRGPLSLVRGDESMRLDVEIPPFVERYADPLRFPGGASVDIANDGRTAFVADADMQATLTVWPTEGEVVPFRSGSDPPGDTVRISDDARFVAYRIADEMPSSLVVVDVTQEPPNVIRSDIRTVRGAADFRGDEENGYRLVATAARLEADGSLRVFERQLIAPFLDLSNASSGQRNAPAGAPPTLSRPGRDADPETAEEIVVVGEDAGPVIWRFSSGFSSVTPVVTAGCTELGRRAFGFGSSVFFTSTRSSAGDCPVGLRRRVAVEPHQAVELDGLELDQSLTLLAASDRFDLVLRTSRDTVIAREVTTAAITDSLRWRTEDTDSPTGVVPNTPPHVVHASVSPNGVWAAYLLEEEAGAADELFVHRIRLRADDE
ncbi:MAG: hypothetical protein AAF938_08005 [Myxococcota bacterium]